MWCNPNPKGDVVARFYAKELAAELGRRTRTHEEARLAWTIYHHPWRTTADLARTGDDLAPFWLPYIYRDDIHGAVLREISSAVETLHTTRVLDAGCGVGFDACFLAGRFPTITFVGTDISEGMLRYAKRRSARLGLQNLTFASASHSQLPNKLAGHAFDLVYAHGSLIFRNVERFREHVAGIAAVLDPGGTFLAEMPNAVDASTFAGIVTELFDFGFHLHPSWGPCLNLTLEGQEVCWIMGFKKQA